MISPKEKANKLFKQFHWIIWEREGDIDPQVAIDCAIKCCDEVLSFMGSDRGVLYWKEVRSELCKMKK